MLGFEKCFCPGILVVKTKPQQQKSVSLLAFEQGACRIRRDQGSFVTYTTPFVQILPHSQIMINAVPSSMLCELCR
jgi:hypothetical protein